MRMIPLAFYKVIIFNIHLSHSLNIVLCKFPVGYWRKRTGNESSVTHGADRSKYTVKIERVKGHSFTLHESHIFDRIVENLYSGPNFMQFCFMIEKDFIQNAEVRKI